MRSTCCEHASPVFVNPIAQGWVSKYAVLTFVFCDSSVRHIVVNQPHWLFLFTEIVPVCGMTMSGCGLQLVPDYPGPHIVDICRYLQLLLLLVMNVDVV